MVIFFNSPMILGGKVVHLAFKQPEPHSLDIRGAGSVKAESCQYFSFYDSAEVVVSNWRVIQGSEYATIDSNGLLTVLPEANSSLVEIACNYEGLTASKTLNVTYVSGSSTETETESEVIVDPDTGQTSEITTTTITTTDAQGNVTVEINTSEIITNADGSSSHVESTEIADPDGSTASNSIQVNYDETGNVVGSSENITNTNADGSSTSTTTNFDENGDPESKINEAVDTSGNVNTQDIEYDENGNEVVTGYNIDTSSNPEGSKNYNLDGVNTDYYAFNITRGFEMRMHFKIDFSNQPPGQNENHHNILTMKRASPSPWYGFQLRQSNTTKYISLGVQFSTGSNSNTSINGQQQGSVYEYDLQITYDPTASTNKFICRNLLTGVDVFTSTNVFPDIEELKYLKVTIGYAMDENGNPFRYSNIDVLDFYINRI